MDIVQKRLLICWDDSWEDYGIKDFKNLKKDELYYSSEKYDLFCEKVTNKEVYLRAYWKDK